jgi:hypothetical protein
MSARISEDVGVVGFGMIQSEPFGRLGPVLRKDYDSKKFEIEFTNPASKEWLEREENHELLHKKLDEYINWFMLLSDKQK